ATDRAGRRVRAPGPDDECPNFAWWCDAGPAAWTGASNPGKTPRLTFSSEFLATLQALTLLARAEDVARSQWDSSAHKQKQQGTLLHRVIFYDHTQHRAGGRGSAHIGGKKMWGLKFTRAHDVPLFCREGGPFPAPSGGLNRTPGCSTPSLPLLRGIA